MLSATDELGSHSPALSMTHSNFDQTRPMATMIEPAYRRWHRAVRQGPISQAHYLRARRAKKTKADQLLQNLDKRLGVLSLAGSLENLAMWAYYAAGHRGFVIELNDRHLFFIHANGTSALRPVNYSRHRARFTMAPITHEQDTELSRQVMTMKSPNWRHEREVRITAYLTQGTDIKKVDKNGFPIILFSLPADAIKRVILGHRMIENNKRDLKKFFVKTDINTFLFSTPSPTTLSLSSNSFPINNGANL
jgi:hypothetical protein